MGINRPLKNVVSAGQTSQNATQKRGLLVINEHFEHDFSALWPSGIVFLQPVKNIPSGNRLIGTGPDEILARFCLVVCLAMLVLTAGCAGWFRPPTQDQDARTLLERLAYSKAGPGNVKAVGSLEVRHGGQIRTLRVALALQMPDRLRVELLSFIGQPLARIAARDGRLQFQEIGRCRGRLETMGGNGLERLLGIKLSVTDLVSVISGGLPERRLVKDNFAIRGKDPGTVLIKTRWHQLRAKIAIGSPPWQLPLSYERYYPDGKLAYRVCWLQWKTVAGQKLPTALRFENERGDRVDLRLRRIWRPDHLPETLFDLAS